MINEKFSHKDFTDKSLKQYKAEDFNNTTIINSCFYQQDKINADIFPDGIKNVTFIQCNLDNVKVPDTCIIGERCCNHQLKVMDDKELWRVNKLGKPIEPHNKNKFIELGLSTNPLKIKKSDKPITMVEEDKLVEELAQEEEKLKNFSLKERLEKLKGLSITNDTGFSGLFGG